MQDTEGSPTDDAPKEVQGSSDAPTSLQDVVPCLFDLTWQGELTLTSMERDFIDGKGGPDNYGEWEAMSREEATEYVFTDRERERFVHGAIVRLALGPHRNRLRTICKACKVFITEIISANLFEELCERAEFQPLPKSRRPTPSITFHITEPDEKSYPPHVLGARLLIWCAASQDTAAFGFDSELFLRLSALKIWAYRKGDKVIANSKALVLIQEAARFIQAIRDESNPSDPSPALASVESKVGKGGRRMDCCGLGLNANRWEVFVKKDGRWQHRGPFKGKIRQGIENDFLKLLLDNPGGLKQLDVLNSVYGNAYTDKKKAMCLRSSVMPAVSRLRKAVREELKIGNSDPFPCNDHAWHSKIALGTVTVDDLGDTVFLPITR